MDKECKTDEKAIVCIAVTVQNIIKSCYFNSFPVVFALPSAETLLSSFLTSKISLLQTRGYLVYLSDGDVPFFRVSFSPLFSSAGYRKKAIFLEPVVKRVYFLKTGCCLARFLRFGVYFSPIFSRIGYRSEGKILEPGKNVCLWWAHPRTIESQVPPPGNFALLQISPDIQLETDFNYRDI